MCPGRGRAYSDYNLQADNLKINQPEQRTVLTGNVVINNDTEQLKAERVIIHYQEMGDTLRRIEAWGHVRLKRDTWTARGDTVEYNVLADSLLVRGNAYVSRAKNEFWGNRIQLDLKVGSLNLIGKVRGIIRQKMLREQS